MRNKDLSEREQLAVRLYVLDDTIGRASLYRLASSRSEEQLAQMGDLPAAATRWFFSGRIQAYYNAQRALFEENKAREKARIEADAANRIAAKAEGKMDHGHIDYSDPRNQLRKLNSIVSNSDDIKDQLDALKLLIGKQMEIAPEKRSGAQVRAYLPLTCYDCPLYRNAKMNNND